MGGARKSPAQKDVTKITVSGLIRPETGTYKYQTHVALRHSSFFRVRGVPGLQLLAHLSCLPLVGLCCAYPW